jgi:hypothetical protein
MESFSTTLLLKVIPDLPEGIFVKSVCLFLQEANNRMLKPMAAIIFFICVVGCNLGKVIV